MGFRGGFRPRGVPESELIYRNRTMSSFSNTSESTKALPAGADRWRVLHAAISVSVQAEADTAAGGTGSTYAVGRVYEEGDTSHTLAIVRPQLVLDRDDPNSRVAYANMAIATPVLGDGIVLPSGAGITMRLRTGGGFGLTFIYAEADFVVFAVPEAV